MDSPRLIFASLLLLLSAVCPAQEIALTFDDAPTGDGPLFSGADRTQRIIKALKENNVGEAAFFVITANVNPKTLPRLEQYVKAGHILANHSHTHRWIHEIGTFSYIDDIRRADDILSRLEGYSKWFRYPFLDEGRTPGARDSIRSGLQSLNLRNGYVTVDNYDWYLNGLLARATSQGKKADEDMLRAVYIDHIYTSLLFYDAIAIKHLGRSPRHVLLLHENDLSALYLGDLIRHLKEKGWKIISPRDAYTDPIATQVPDVLFNGQGRVAAIARSKGIPARELVQATEDEAYLDSLLLQRNVFK